MTAVTYHAAAPTLPVDRVAPQWRRVVGLAAGAIARINASARAAHSQDRLMAMDDRMLRDIGVTRAALRHATGRLLS